MFNRRKRKGESKLINCKCKTMKPSSSREARCQTTRVRRKGIVVLCLCSCHVIIIHHFSHLVNILWGIEQRRARKSWNLEDKNEVFKMFMKFMLCSRSLLAWLGIFHLLVREIHKSADLFALLFFVWAVESLASKAYFWELWAFKVLQRWWDYSRFSHQFALEREMTFGA